MNLFRTDLTYCRLILAAHLSLLISYVVIGACERPWLCVDLDMTAILQLMRRINRCASTPLSPVSQKSASMNAF